MKDFITKILIPWSGVVLISLSEFTNPGYGFLDKWAFLIGISIVTATITISHAEAEAIRIIQGTHWSRVIFRSLYFAIVTLFVYREVSIEAGIFFVNQSLLFGVIFDPARNHFTGAQFFYHGGESLYDRIVRKHAIEVFYIEILLFLGTLIYLL